MEDHEEEEADGHTTHPESIVPTVTVGKHGMQTGVKTRKWSLRRKRMSCVR